MIGFGQNEQGGFGGLGTPTRRMPIDQHTHMRQGSDSGGPAPVGTLTSVTAPPVGAAPVPGAPSSSPLGMWQDWLKSMGPFLAQMPFSQPNAESGGLSSLAPSSAGMSKIGYSGPDTPWQGNRGFRSINSQ